ncbi:hypothetical protein [Lutibacter citreus]|uniref:hypothetical protein n=1 Tax=Lutibacter citreus TaxID=2138210 RepID=UPI000DBE8380|nr:hypothetical protein [Lutibacter citreus]
MYLKSLLIFFIGLIYLNTNLVKAQKSTIETMGDIGLIVVPLAAVSTTFIKGDRQGSWQFTKGFLLNQVLTNH